MDLTELLPSLYGFRSDLQAGDGRVPNMLRRAARRVCRETQLVEQETVLVLDSKNSLVAIPGTSVLNQTAPKSRQSAAIVTAPVISGATVFAELPLSISCDLINVETDTPAWVRVYGSAEARLADAYRPYTEDPLPGTGLMGEVATYLPDFLKINFSPVPFFDNLDPVVGATAYLAITPMLNPFDGPVTLTFTYLPQEFAYPGPGYSGLGVQGYGALGDMILSNGAIVADESLGWEQGVRLNVLAWKRLYFTDNTNKVNPGIPEAKNQDDYQDWLLLKAEGQVMAPGKPEVYSDVMGTLRVAPAWSVGNPWNTLIARLAVEPTGNFMQIPGLPSAAEEAVLNLAYAEILGFPGRGANPGLAQGYRNAGLNLCGALRSQRVLGSAPSQRELSNPFNFRVR